MTGEMVRDRVFLALLFVVGGSSLLWGLYLIFYVSPNAASGLFNTVLGLLVLLVTGAYLVPYVLPRNTPSPNRRPASTPAPVPRRPVSVAAPASTVPPAARPATPTVPGARPTPRPVPMSGRPTSRAVAVAPSWTARPILESRPAITRSAAIARPPPSREDLEIAEILADLPGPVDDTLSAASPDEMVRRLDALLRDLAADSSADRVVRPR